jgi:hypothetical protein
MEASGTPTPEPAQTPPPPPPPPPTVGPEAEKASAGWRALAVGLALALAFGAAVMFVVAINPDDTPRCDQPGLSQIAGECFDVTKAQQTIQMVFAWAAGIVGAAAALVALAVAFTGRRGALMVRLTGAAVVLGVITVIIGQL